MLAVVFEGAQILILLSLEMIISNRYLYYYYYYTKVYLLYVLLCII